jgi:hypothetical protein
VGVGGFVYNAEKRELLVVREKYNPTGMGSPFKLPGGYVKAGKATLSTHATRTHARKRHTRTHEH